MDNPKEEQLDIKSLDVKEFWRRLWALIRPSHRQIRNLLFLIMFIELLRLGSPYILKIIIDQVTNFDPSQTKNLFLLIGAMFLANQAVSFLAFFEDRKIFNILIGAEQYLSNNAHERMVNLDLNYHEKENTGNKIIKIQRGTDKILELLGNTFWEVLPTTLQIIFTTIVLFYLDWRFGLTLLFFVPIFVTLTLKINRNVYPLRRKRFDEQEVSAGVMAQAIININTVKSFVQEKREIRGYRKIRESIKNLLNLEWEKFLRYNLRRNFVIDAGRAMMMLLGVFFVWQGSLSVGSLVFVYTISEKALISLFRISRLYDRIMESGEAVQRLYDLSLTKPLIKNPQNGLHPKTIQGNIEFKEVNFVYKESGIKALDGVNLKINSGCVTALVGPSGGGKTTLARMIYRHYDPDKGTVLLDGKDIKNYDLYAFRQFFAIVPQEVEIFNCSVAENISYAKPEASQEEIRAAAKIANAEEFILRFREGYDTLVGERGMKLSGGQRQRVGIARAILANPKVLIFDEATSNLDSQSEKLIQEAMDKIRKGRTVIIIAHRLSTIKKADKIVVLEKGQVVEQGSHWKLAKTDGGLYQKLINLQQMGDVE